MDQVHEWVQSVRSHIPGHLDEVERYIETLKRISKEEIIDDFKNLRLSAITVTISLTAFTTLLFFGSLLTSSLAGDSSGSKKKKKPRKKISKTQRANLDIQETLDFVESEYVPKIEEYIENYKTWPKEDREYKYNYFEEMLLKQLMKLDGIDVVGNDILRDNRKKVIKFIQDHQKRLDKVKKENS